MGGWDLGSFADLVDDKFNKTPLIDVTTKLTEMQTIRLALQALRAWGVRMSEVSDIPQLWHLMFYHDDEYASKLIAGKDDQMQTAKATLFALSGDCEDIHRLYQLTAVVLGVPAPLSWLMVIFFGSSEKIIGAHATTLIYKDGSYINLDYDRVITSSSISGILGYHSQYGMPQLYVLLKIDTKTLRDPVVKYKSPPEAHEAQISNNFKVIEVQESENLKKLKYHLHRTAEHEKGVKKYTPWILLAGGIVVGTLIGGVRQ